MKHHIVIQIELFLLTIQLLAIAADLHDVTIDSVRVNVSF